MIFKGINNQVVELKVNNYQFPEITNCEYDSNWLLIYINVRSMFGNWETIDPSLLTIDLFEIKKWFKNLSNNVNVEKSLNFIEPNISFELINFDNSHKCFRILFDLESRPQNADDEKEYFVDCKLDNNDLKKIVLDLEKEIEKFPTRA